MFTLKCVCVCVCTAARPTGARPRRPPSSEDAGSLRQDRRGKPELEGETSTNTQTCVQVDVPAKTSGAWATRQLHLRTYTQHDNYVTRQLRHYAPTAVDLHAVR